MPGHHELSAQSRSPRDDGTSGEVGLDRSRSLRTSFDARSRPDNHTPSHGGPTSNSYVPTSPTTELAQLGSAPITPHLDICKYPTQQLLKLLAGLLQHIASSNDQLRAELEDEDEDDRDDEHDVEIPSASNASLKSRSRSRASALSHRGDYHPGSSPTTELFDTSRSPSTMPSPSSSTYKSNPASTSYPLSQFPLFTASKTSLSHSSALLAFHARHIPSISIEAYLLRILKYCPTTNEVFLGVLVYFDRMTKLGTPSGIGGKDAKVGKRGKGFAIDSFNVHRLVIAGVTVASKFFSDVFYTNSRYAKVGGLPHTELNFLELQFLLLSDFRLRVSVDEMQRYGDRLLAYAEEAGEDIGDIGVERRPSVSSEIGNESGEDDARARVESQRGSQRQSESAPTTEDTHGAHVSSASLRGDLSFPGVPPPSSSQAALPPNDAPPPATAPVSPGNSQMSRPPPLAKSQTQPQIPQAHLLSSTPSSGLVTGSDGSGLQSVEPRGREPGIAESVRDWVRGDDPMGVAGARMTSPMRD